MPYTSEILHEIARFVNRVPNRISLTGHTDTANYATRIGYSNWELTADRANAARRALLEGGMEAAKVARVVGFGSAVLFDAGNPLNPINRRISIVVMTKEAEDAALTRNQGTPAPVPAAAAAAAPPGSPTPGG